METLRARAFEELSRRPEVTGVRLLQFVTRPASYDHDLNVRIASVQPLLLEPRVDCFPAMPNRELPHVVSPCAPVVDN